MKLRNIIILLVIFLALGVYFIFFRPTEPPEPPPEPKEFVWMIEMDDIQHIEIQLPREGESQAFIKEEVKDAFPWYFDDPQRSAIDTKRWGGGIPLLLSGPAASRLIAKNATEEKLAEFGLAQPRMEITLTLKDGDILKITIGDNTPDGAAFYVQAPGSNDVATVDYSWYGVIERLVKEPPYASSSSD